MREPLRRLVKLARPALQSDAERLISALIVRPASRKCLNYLYSALPWEQKAQFHSRFSKLFSIGPNKLKDGYWTINFAGVPITLPLTDKQTWLEWDSAISVLGHETEIKITYESLIRSNNRPHIFFDIGANYGGHSLLFLAHGIDTVSFEPNQTCHPYFRRICDVNGVECNLQPVALGETIGSIELWFPESETWLGTTDQDVSNALRQRGNLKKLVVQQTTLDQFVAQYAKYPQLIKIDTEGNELRVLQGGNATLKESTPLVIFETWRGPNREKLFTLFDQLGYRICALPLLSKVQPQILTRERFQEANESNFIAISIEKLKHGDFWK